MLPLSRRCQSQSEFTHTDYSPTGTLAQTIPFSSAKRRGRVQVRRKNDSEQIFYLSKTLWTNEAGLGRIMLTKAAIEALVVVYDPATAKEQTLHLPDVSTNRS